MVANNDTSGFDGHAHELGKDISWSAGNKFLEHVFFNHPRPFEDVGERLDIHSHSRFHGCLVDADEHKTVVEMFIEEIVGSLLPFSELSLSPRLDISWITWNKEGRKTTQDPPKAERREGGGSVP